MEIIAYKLKKSNYSCLQVTGSISINILLSHNSNSKSPTNSNTDNNPCIQEILSKHSTKIQPFHEVAVWNEVSNVRGDVVSPKQYPKGLQRDMLHIFGTSLEASVSWVTPLPSPHSALVIVL